MSILNYNFSKHCVISYISRLLSDILSHHYIFEYFRIFILLFHYLEKNLYFILNNEIIFDELSVQLITL